MIVENMANGPISNAESDSSIQGNNRRYWGSMLAASGLAGLGYLLTWLHTSLPSWMADWLKWCPTSAEALEEAESKLLSYLRQPYKVSYVSINSIGEEKEKHKIHTLSMNTEAKNKEMPLVMLHGFASGIGLWVLNLDSLSQNRPLYIFDILGFGRSSRPAFSKDASEVEKQLVGSIEEWREQMGLQKFILLGHSMGGFLASSYALQYPDRVSHLILADPWGFPERHENAVSNFRPPMWVRVIATMLQPFNPLAGLRAAGPWGPRLVEKFRPDLVRKFSSVVEDSEAVPSYIYHCNAQTPSGEVAFKVMASHFGWAKYPMQNRIGHLRKDIPITFIYGSQSWVDCNSGIRIKDARNDSYVDVKLIQEAGHHVYADNAEEFNSLVQNACNTFSEKLTDGLAHSSNSYLKRQSAMMEQVQNEMTNASVSKNSEHTQNAVVF